MFQAAGQRGFDRLDVIRGILANPHHRFGLLTLHRSNFIRDPCVALVFQPPAYGLTRMLQTCGVS